MLAAGLCTALPLGDDDYREAETPAAYSPASTPQLEFSVRRDRLQLHAHTVSAAHEARLRAALDRLAPGRQVTLEFRPLGTAPGYWQDATLALLPAFAGLPSATAVLAGTALHVRAVVEDPAGWRARVAPLLAAVPHAPPPDIELMPVAAHADVADYCRRAFAAFEPGPVRFEESGTRLRASAQPVLDRVAVLADACRDAVVTITGHTDASGSPVLNHQLSVDRAAAVADALVRRGISRGRLLTIGAGASRAIANNRTRYGRSLNRRIEIGFSLPGDAPPR